MRSAISGLVQMLIGTTVFSARSASAIQPATRRPAQGAGNEASMRPCNWRMSLVPALPAGSNRPP